jgi:hypothetical protein
VGERPLVAGSALAVAIPQDDLVADRVRVRVDGSRRGGRAPASVDPDVGEVRPEARFHALPDRRLQGRATAPADHVLHRRLLLRLAVEEPGHARVPRGTLEAQDRGVAQRVGAAGGRRPGRERRRSVVSAGPPDRTALRRLPLVLVAVHAGILPHGRGVV